jgi:hypothetical protein
MAMIITSAPTESADKNAAQPFLRKVMATKAMISKATAVANQIVSNTWRLDIYLKGNFLFWHG